MVFFFLSIKAKHTSKIIFIAYLQVSCSCYQTARHCLQPHDLYWGVFFLFVYLFRYRCHTLPPVSPRAVGTVTQSKVLWTGTRVLSCRLTNCRVSGTLPTPTEGNTATTALLHTHNKVCRHRVKEKHAATDNKHWKHHHPEFQAVLQASVLANGQNFG